MDKIIGQAICPHCHCIGTTSLSFMNNHFDNCPEKIDRSEGQVEAEVDVKIVDSGKLNEIFAQCSDCHYNWNFIKNEKKSGRGWCYLFKDYIPICIRKLKVNDYQNNFSD